MHRDASYSSFTVLVRYWLILYVLAYCYIFIRNSESKMFEWNEREASEMKTWNARMENDTASGQRNSFAELISINEAKWISDSEAVEPVKREMLLNDCCMPSLPSLSLILFHSGAHSSFHKINCSLAAPIASRSWMPALQVFVSPFTSLVAIPFMIYFYLVLPLSTICKNTLYLKP